MTIPLGFPCAIAAAKKHISACDHVKQAVSQSSTCSLRVSMVRLNWSNSLWKFVSEMCPKKAALCFNMIACWWTTTIHGNETTYPKTNLSFNWLFENLFEPRTCRLIYLAAVYCCYAHFMATAVALWAGVALVEIVMANELLMPATPLLIQNQP